MAGFLPLNKKRMLLIFFFLNRTFDLQVLSYSITLFMYIFLQKCKNSHIQNRLIVILFFFFIIWIVVKHEMLIYLGTITIFKFNSKVSFLNHHILHLSDFYISYFSNFFCKYTNLIHLLSRFDTFYCLDTFSFRW